MICCGIEHRFKGDYQAIFAVEAGENQTHAARREIYPNPL
jgi:hypothetical protein